MEENSKELMQDIAKDKIKIILSSIAEAVLVIMELYIMINFKSNFIAMAVIILIMIAALFFLISGIMDLTMKSKDIEQKKYEDIYNAQKASYLVIRKSFEEMDERLRNIEENSALPAEEIISAQKAVAKVTISRSKENTDALMNSNDELINQLFSIQEKMDESNSELLGKQQELLNATRDELQKKIEEITSQISSIEGRIGNGIVQASPIVTPPVVEQAPAVEPEIIEQMPEVDVQPDDLGLDLDTPIQEESQEENNDLDIDLDLETSEEITEEVQEDIGLDLDNSLDIDSPQEENEEPALDLDINLDELNINATVEETEASEETISEELPELEEAPQEDAQEEAVVEEPIAEEPVAEEVVAEEPVAEEPVMEEPVAEEPIVEEPATEEPVEQEPEQSAAPAPVPIPDVGIDLSDPNRVMSPEEIEKLFASI